MPEHALEFVEPVSSGFQRNGIIESLSLERRKIYLMLHAN